MARIADDVVGRIKTDISLLRLVESQGYAPKKQGKDYALSCPFHEGDNEPSLIITPKSNLFHCFGCDAGGSVIDWVMKTQGVSFRHAAELLRDDLTLAAGSVGSSASVKKTTVPKLAAPVTQSTDDQAVLAQVIDYYHQTLKQESEAQAYLAERGLDNAELINTFKLGYANRTLGLRLPNKNRKAGKEIREQLQRIGLYRDTGREHFNGSLVVPVLDERGVISEVYGRKLLDNLRKGTPRHLYLPGPHAGVWNVQALMASKEIIVCEALIDAMTFWAHGFRHVTASYGTSGFTDDHLQAFKAHGIERVLIAYDRDTAGNKAAETLAKKLIAEGIDCFRILLPKGMDVNEYALTTTPAAKVLGLAVRKAEWLGQGKAPAVGTTAAKENPPPLAPSPPEKTAEPAIPSNPGTVLPLAAALPEHQSSPLPSVPPAIEVQVTENEVLLSFGNRHYRVRGFNPVTSLTHLKINLMARCDELFHMDKLDLYSSKQRQVFINQASAELGVKDDIIKKDLGKLLLQLEGLQDQGGGKTESPTKTLTDEERQQALALLKDPALLNRILADFTSAGVVGEGTNKLVGYLACVSRNLDKPLAVMIQSSSAAGKSSLMEAVLALMPEEERVQYSAMTGQSLFYMGETNLKHKILAIAEEEGASNASYALKLLQSEGVVTIASTGKDENTGELVTRDYKVEGPVMLFLTTTAIDIDEELKNRCIVLDVDEGRAQTAAIHTAQRHRRTLAGLHATLETQQITALHRNAQRVLRPLRVINPFADQLTFLDDKTRLRRDHEKYLTLIDSIALLHQYQREIKTEHYNGEAIEYVEVTLEDIAAANQLAHEVLGKSLDELPPQTRRLLNALHEHVSAQCDAQQIQRNDYRFSRKAIRQHIGWSYDQLRVHLGRLVDMEYVLVHRGGRGQSFDYELLYNGEGEGREAFLIGLIDVDALADTVGTTATLGGQTANLGGPLGGHWGANGCRDGGEEKPHQPSEHGAYEEQQLDFVENAYSGKNNSQSYPHDHRSDTPLLAADLEH